MYTGRHSDRGSSPSGWLPYVPWALAGLTITGQIIWVLVGDQPRIALTIGTVVTFFLASATHAYLSRGLSWTAGYLAISLGFGLAIEAIGTATRFPFGDYTYTSVLGPAVLGVPILIPLAWSMMAYPCLLAAQRLVCRQWARHRIGGRLAIRLLGSVPGSTDGQRGGMAVEFGGLGSTRYPRHPIAEFPRLAADGIRLNVAP